MTPKNKSRRLLRLKTWKNAKTEWSKVACIALFVNVFLFKHRNRQLLINRVVWVVFTLFWGSMVYLIVQQGKEFSPYLADLGLAFVGEVALLMANRYIAKDEALIRSLDRLR